MASCSDAESKHRHCGGAIRLHVGRLTGGGFEL
jgi:hypothetical protein